MVIKSLPIHVIFDVSSVDRIVGKVCAIIDIFYLVFRTAMIVCSHANPGANPTRAYINKTLLNNVSIATIMASDTMIISCTALSLASSPCNPVFMTIQCLLLFVKMMIWPI